MTTHTNYTTRPSGDQLPLPLELSERPRYWRPIHYLGSKLRLAESIRSILADLDPSYGTACDLFAGSGTVSMVLSNERSVVAADIQEYSRVICSALLNPAQVDQTFVDSLCCDIERRKESIESYLEPILWYETRAIENANKNPSELCDLIESGSLLSVDSGNVALTHAISETNNRLAHNGCVPLATRYFGGTYFSYHQSLVIDSVLSAIGSLAPYYRDTCLAALLSTASTIVNTIGKQFAQPIRPRLSDGTIKQRLINQICRDRTYETIDVFRAWLSRYGSLCPLEGNQAIRADYREVLSNIKSISVIYADPPYTRDHYSRFYHVLETLCLQDFPEISEVSPYRPGRISRGLYRSERHQSPFSIKSQAAKAFATLFDRASRHKVPLLLSYSPYIKNGHPRMMTIDAVTKLAANCYRYVDVIEAAPVTHSKLNKSELHLDALDTAEVFIICKH